MDRVEVMGLLAELLEELLISYHPMNMTNIYAVLVICQALCWGLGIQW